MSHCYPFNLNKSFHVNKNKKYFLHKSTQSVCTQRFKVVPLRMIKYTEHNCATKRYLSVQENHPVC